MEPLEHHTKYKPDMQYDNKDISLVDNLRKTNMKLRKSFVNLLTTLIQFYYCTIQHEDSLSHIQAVSRVPNAVTITLECLDSSPANPDMSLI